MLTPLQLELRKLRPRLLFSAAIALPTLVTAAKTAGFLQRQARLVEQERWHWDAFFAAAGFQWYSLVLPIITASLAAYLCAVEYENGTWKLLLSQPNGRIRPLFAKWLAGFCVLIVLSVTWTGAHLLAGIWLGLDGSPNRWLIHTPWMVPLGQAAILTFHLWLATRAQHVLVPIGAVLPGILFTQLLEIPGLVRWLPWRMSALPMFAGSDFPIWEILSTTGGATLMIGVLAGFDFARRDWTD